MAGEAKRAFTGTFSQSVVVCLLVVFIVMVLVAMFSTAFVTDETDWIGMTVKPLGSETAAALGIPADVGGVVVDDVEGMAQKAGIRHGDVLKRINGKPIRDMNDFLDLAGKADLPQRGAQLDVIRQGAQIPVFVSPNGAVQGRMRAPGASPPAGVGRTPMVFDRQWLGIDAERFAAGEARALGIPAGVGGVLIDGVVRGSRAERAGLLANDVIVSVNGRKTDSTADLWNMLADTNGANWAELSLYRGGQLMSIALPVASGALVGGFPGRMGGLGLGPGGTLVCPKCGTRVAHQRAVPCYTVPCPSCGTPMMRTR